MGQLTLIHTNRHAIRRTLILAAPVIALGLALFIAGGIPATELSGAGLILATLATLGAVFDLTHPHNH